ncbi:bifunctional 3-demethylubiquinone 3-O-methyltransferase/2-octaprenyl-6-hydroxy phenol methylase [Magnetospira thiophila]
MTEPAPAAHPSTALPEEVARFAAMAEAWWDPDGKFRPLHRFNPTRMTFIRDQVAAHFERDPLGDRPLAGLRVLDIGCGGGLLCEPLHRLGACVTGIDAAEKNIGIAAAHAQSLGLDITYRHALPEDLVAEGLQFDLVTNMEVIEHVADPSHFLALSCALIRPGGAMTLATMNRTLKALALGKIGAEYLLRWLPAGTHDWRKFVRPSELAHGLRPHGVHIRALKGLSFRPLSDRWDLTDDLDVNYLAFCTKD